MSPGFFTYPALCANKNTYNVIVMTHGNYKAHALNQFNVSTNGIPPALISVLTHAQIATAQDRRDSIYRSCRSSVLSSNFRTPPVAVLM